MRLSPYNKIMVRGVRGSRQLSSATGKIALALFILAVCKAKFDIDSPRRMLQSLRDENDSTTATLAKTTKVPSSPQTSVYKHDNSNMTAGGQKCTEEQRKDIDRQLMLSKPKTRLDLGFFQSMSRLIVDRRLLASSADLP